MARTALVVDDHPAFRRLARRMLADAGFEVIGEAQDAHGAVGAIAALRPDVVLLDVLLPDETAIWVLRRLAGSPAAPAIVLTSSRTRESLGVALDVPGARGFVAKHELSGAAVMALAGAP
jgi:DNA-binding NarL/FixJ family response regulator